MKESGVPRPELRGVICHRSLELGTLISARTAYARKPGKFGLWASDERAREEYNG